MVSFAICLSPMKRLLLAAALLTTAAAPAMAQPTHLFSINTANPRSIDFKGTGTANFNNSTGTQNNFNVGSSTNLGVNGSINATRDYGGTSDGTLQLAGTSVMQQTIGTSGNAANVQAASQAAGLAAYTSANQFAKKTTEDNFGTSYNEANVAKYVTDANGDAVLDGDGNKQWTNLTDDTYRKADGSILSVDEISSAQDWVTQKNDFERSKFNSQYASDYATTLEQSQMVGNWKYDSVQTELAATDKADELFGSSYSQYETLHGDSKITDTNALGSAGAKLGQDSWEAARSQFIQTEINENRVNQNGVTLGEFAAAQGGSSSSKEEQFGIIKGDFKTTNSASTGSTGSHQEWIDAARKSANEKLGINLADMGNGSSGGKDLNGNVLDGGDAEYGATYADRTTKSAEIAALSEADWNAGKADYAESQWKTAWDSAFDAAYTSAQTGSTFNESVSTVTVTGVGNIANVNASGQSKFNVNLSPRDIPAYEAQVAALNGALYNSTDGSIKHLGVGDAAGTGVSAQPIIFPEENGSASGSSGANLSTSSYANQSNSESASAFIQAFAASQKPAN